MIAMLARRILVYVPERASDRPIPCTSGGGTRNYSQRLSNREYHRVKRPQTKSLIEVNAENVRDECRAAWSVRDFASLLTVMDNGDAFRRYGFLTASALCFAMSPRVFKASNRCGKPSKGLALILIRYVPAVVIASVHLAIDREHDMHCCADHRSDRAHRQNFELPFFGISHWSGLSGNPFKVDDSLRRVLRKEFAHDTSPFAAPGPCQRLRDFGAVDVAGASGASLAASAAGFATLVNFGSASTPLT